MLLFFLGTLEERRTAPVAPPRPDGRWPRRVHPLHPLGDDRQTAGGHASSSSARSSRVLARQPPEFLGMVTGEQAAPMPASTRPLAAAAAAALRPRTVGGRAPELRGKQANLCWQFGTNQAD